MTLPTAMLFDLDGTILDDGDRRTVLLEVATEQRALLGSHDPARVANRLEDAFAAFWSDPTRHRIARFGLAEARLGVVTEVFVDLDLQPDAARAFSETFNERRAQATTLFLGARDTLVSIRAQGVRLALVTNGPSDTQRAKIERFTLADLFDHIQIEGECGFGKPEDQAYHHALAILGVRAQETWMIGDHLEWEVAAPQRHGIYAVWHDPYARGLPAGTAVRPDRIITRFADLLG